MVGNQIIILIIGHSFGYDFSFIIPNGKCKPTFSINVSKPFWWYIESPIWIKFNIWTLFSNIIRICTKHYSQSVYHSWLLKIHLFTFKKCVWILVHFHDPLSFWCFFFGYKFKVMITSPWLRSWQSARQFYVDKKGFVHVQIRKKNFSTFCLKTWAKFKQLLTKKHKL